MRRLGRNRDVKSKLDLGEVSNEREKELKEERTVWDSWARGQTTENIVNMRNTGFLNFQIVI